MSRKRFIKLMMARGYSRNLAEALATRVPQYGSYAAMYQQLVSGATFAEVLSDAILGVFNALAVVCDSVAAAFSSVAASMRRSAERE